MNAKPYSKPYNDCPIQHAVAKAVLLEESQGALMSSYTRNFGCPTLISFHKSKVVQVAQRQQLDTCGTWTVLAVAKSCLVYQQYY